jgi:hypothetical protein
MFKTSVDVGTVSRGVDITQLSRDVKKVATDGARCKTSVYLKKQMVNFHQLHSPEQKPSQERE